MEYLLGARTWTLPVPFCLPLVPFRLPLIRQLDNPNYSMPRHVLYGG